MPRVQEVISTLQKQTDDFLAKREKDKNDLTEQLARISLERNSSASAMSSPPVGLQPISTAMGQPVSQDSSYHQHAHFVRIAFFFFFRYQFSQVNLAESHPSSFFFSRMPSSRGLPLPSSSRGLPLPSSSRGLPLRSLCKMLRFLLLLLVLVL